MSVRRSVVPDLLAEFGVLLQRDFLDRETRRRFIDEMSSSPRRPAAFYEARVGYETNEAVWKPKSVEVSRATRNLLDARLMKIKGKLEDHFGTKLSGYEPEFLVYEKGDYGAPHRDRLETDDTPEQIKRRVVAISIFLNPQTQRPARDSYGGGSLILYGLIKNPLWSRYGLAIPGEAGLLVAFQPDLLHEIKPVTRGQRFTVVCRFLRDPGH